MEPYSTTGLASAVPTRYTPRIMKKIPTIYLRGSDGKVTAQRHPNCHWVFRGEGIATEKLDGINVRLTTIGQLVTKVEMRQDPTDAQILEGVVDPLYVEIDIALPMHRNIRNAVNATDTAKWLDGAHSCEAIGPLIKGNPLDLLTPRCVPFDMLDVFTLTTFSYDMPQVARTLHFSRFGARMSRLRSRYARQEKRSRVFAEGLVFHHPDGRMAKIKRLDFPG